MSYRGGEPDSGNDEKPVHTSPPRRPRNYSPSELWSISKYEMGACALLAASGLLKCVDRSLLPPEASSSSARFNLPTAQCKFGYKRDQGEPRLEEVEACGESPSPRLQPPSVYRVYPPESPLAALRR